LDGLPLAALSNSIRSDGAEGEETGDELALELAADFILKRISRHLRSS